MVNNYIYIFISIYSVKNNNIWGFNFSFLISFDQPFQMIIFLISKWWVVMTCLDFLRN